MIFPLNSITKRLFFSFGILVFNIVIITVVALFFLQRTRVIGGLTQRIDNQRVRIIQLIKTDLDFLRFETVNVKYFETGESQILVERDSLFKIIDHENTLLSREIIAQNFMQDLAFVSLDTALRRYSATFERITAKINERGFKDFGVEGHMRICAHELENHTSGLAMADLLMLRRHEKDFLLRRETKYINSFTALSQKLVLQLRNKGYWSSAFLLSEYTSGFIKLSELSYEIGNSPDTGLLGALNQETRSISQQLVVQLVQLAILLHNFVELVFQLSTQLNKRLRE